MSLRLATASDVDVITDISVAALADDSSHNYRYPYRKEYYEDYVEYNRARFVETLANPDFITMLYECPSNEDPAIVKPVALAIWQLPPPQRSGKNMIFSHWADFHSRPFR
jgi:hypothetical protein